MHQRRIGAVVKFFAVRQVVYALERSGGVVGRHDHGISRAHYHKNTLVGILGFYYLAAFNKHRTVHDAGFGLKLYKRFVERSILVLQLGNGSALTGESVDRRLKRVHGFCYLEVLV